MDADDDHARGSGSCSTVELNPIYRNLPAAPAHGTETEPHPPSPHSHPHPADRRNHTTTQRYHSLGSRLVPPGGATTAPLGNLEEPKGDGDCLLDPLWLDPAETLPENMVPKDQRNTRNIRVMIESMSSRTITVTYVCLVVILFVPDIVASFLSNSSLDLWNYDVWFKEIRPCNSSPEANHICNQVAVARLWLSYILAAILVLWLAMVWREWRGRELVFVHATVALYMVGQVMLEDPYSAYLVYYRGEYDKMTVNGELRGIEPYGCALMSLANAILIDKCAHAALGTQRTLLQRLQRASLLFLISLWPVLTYYKHTLIHYKESDAFFIVRHALVVLSLVAFAYEWLSAYKALGKASYMKFRYENLLLRLIIPPILVNLVTVALYGEYLISVYVTTTLPALFLLYCHLPPGRHHFHPILRRRHPGDGGSVTGFGGFGGEFGGDMSNDGDSNDDDDDEDEGRGNSNDGEGLDVRSQLSFGGNVMSSFRSVFVPSVHVRKTGGLLGLFDVKTESEQPEFCFEVAAMAFNLSLSVYFNAPNDDFDHGSKGEQEEEEGEVKRQDAAAEDGPEPNSALSSNPGFVPAASATQEASGSNDIESGCMPVSEAAAAPQAEAVPPTPAAPQPSGQQRMGDRELEKLEKSGIFLRAFLRESSRSYCMVFLEPAAETLWISFRGTVTKEQVDVDLDSRQIPLRVEECPSAADHHHHHHQAQERNTNTDAASTWGGVSAIPGLNLLPLLLHNIGFDDVKAHVHRGFWLAYESIRNPLIAAVVSELNLNPSIRRINFTGHSLGGALATLAILDLSLYFQEHRSLVYKADLVAGVCCYSSRKEGEDEEQLQSRGAQQREGGGGGSDGQGNRAQQQQHRQQQERMRECGRYASNAASVAVDLAPMIDHQPRLEKPPLLEDGHESRQYLMCQLYTFGAPRVGDHAFNDLFELYVDSAFRVITEGDVVPGLPAAVWGLVVGVTTYKHNGIPVYMLSKGRGDLLVEPGSAEKVFYLKWSRDPWAHRMKTYLRRLQEVFKHVPDLEAEGKKKVKEKQ